jgi:hypothetical protein
MRLQNFEVLDTVPPNPCNENIGKHVKFTPFRNKNSQERQLLVVGRF